MIHSFLAIPFDFTSFFTQVILKGHLDSVEWDDGLEWWNGMEWQ